jgi:hypothetical protein
MVRGERHGSSGISKEYNVKDILVSLVDVLDRSPRRLETDVSEMEFGRTPPKGGDTVMT